MGEPDEGDGDKLTDDERWFIRALCVGIANGARGANPEHRMPPEKLITSLVEAAEMVRWFTQRGER